MKNNILCITIVLSLLLGSTSVFAGEDKKKACEMILCLYGEKSGLNQTECDPAIKAYKKIAKKSKWSGKILCSATKELRLAQLLLCEQDEYDVKKLVDCNK